MQKKRTEAGRVTVDGKGNKRSNKSFLSCNAGVSDRAARDKQQLDEETVTPQKARYSFTVFTYIKQALNNLSIYVTSCSSEFSPHDFSFIH